GEARTEACVLGRPDNGQPHRLQRVYEWRLREELLTVDVWGDPVAGKHHLAGRLREHALRVGEAGPVEPPGEDGEGENQDEQQARCHPTAPFFRTARRAGSARTRRPVRARTADETPSTCSRRSSRA